MASPMLQKQCLFLQMLWMRKQQSEQMNLYTEGSDHWKWGPQVSSSGPQGPPGAGYTCASWGKADSSWDLQLCECLLSDQASLEEGPESVIKCDKIYSTPGKWFFCCGSCVSVTKKYTFWTRGSLSLKSRYWKCSFTSLDIYWAPNTRQARPCVRTRVENKIHMVPTSAHPWNAQNKSLKQTAKKHRRNSSFI